MRNNPVHPAAQVLLAGLFAYGGAVTLADPQPRAAAASGLLAQIRRRVPRLPGDLTVVRANAGIQVGAGMMLACGCLPRSAAATLAGSLIPTTIAGHPFWAAQDPGTRTAEAIQAAKNAAVLAGLLLAACPPPRRPGRPAEGRAPVRAVI